MCHFVYICSGHLYVDRGCISSVGLLLLGCDSTTTQDGSAYACYCDTDRCNGAVMMSSVGHVIIMVALFINVVVGYLL